MGLGGVGGGVVALVLEKLVLDSTELTFRVSESGLFGALLATFLLAAPLEEALKLLPIWILYRARRIGNPQVGLTYAAACAAGFAASESVIMLATEGTAGGTLLRLA